jgi:hypothetical protein
VLLDSEGERIQRIINKDDVREAEDFVTRYSIARV